MELVLSDGLNTVKVKGSGLWPVPAVMAYPAFNVLAKVAKLADQEKPFVLEGVGNQVKAGNATFACSFQRAEINVQGVLSSERERQRVTEDNADIFGTGSAGQFGSAWFLRQIKGLYPDADTGSAIEYVLVTIPAFPNLVIHVRPAWAEFRIAADPAAAPMDWRTSSELWKRFGYPVIGELGVDALLRWAGKIAARKINQKANETR